MAVRRWLPTFAELVDRLSIVTLKSVRGGSNKAEYEAEARDLMADIGELAKEKGLVMDGEMVRAVELVMLANAAIWENEWKARAGGSEQDGLLKFTHAVNGVRTRAKNAISSKAGERVDLKVDCLAAEVCRKQGWDFGGVFPEAS